MTSPAWNGPTVTAACDNCGAFGTIKGPEALSSPEKHERTRCNGCEQQVTWTVWDGPVMPV